MWRWMISGNPGLYTHRTSMPNVTFFHVSLPQIDHVGPENMMPDNQI